MWRGVVVGHASCGLADARLPQTAVPYDSPYMLMI